MEKQNDFHIDRCSFLKKNIFDAMGDREKASSEDVLGVVITYNPDLSRLRECLKALTGQIVNIMIFDNASQNINDIENVLYLVSDDHIRAWVDKSTHNVGVACALKKAMIEAKKRGYSWVLTVDQDSVLQPGTLNKYMEVINNPEYSDAGMFTCLIRDRNFRDKKHEVQNEPVRPVAFCITSGALTNVRDYFKTPGYDETFFIDCVDFDLCYSLREAGFKIYRINHMGILHEVGRGAQRKFFWKKIIVYNEKTERIYYLTRNTGWLYKKHSNYRKAQLIRKEMAILCRIILYETPKKDKIRAFNKGIMDIEKYGS